MAQFNQKLFVTFLTFSILIYSVHSEKQDKPSGKAKYLGRFSSSKNFNSKGISVQESDYYVIEQGESWHLAVETCQRQVQGCLVSIETLEEISSLNKVVEELGSNSYWTSGRYSSAYQDWVWTCNNEVYPLPPQINRPWAPGHPKTPNSLLRIVMNHEFGNHTWSTHPEAESHHAIICEVAPIDSPIPCYKETDLSVVLDSSGSIGPDYYELAKTFISKLSRAFTQYAQSRFNLIIYSDDAQNIIPLNSLMTPAQIQEEIMKTIYLGSGTSTHLGIGTSTQELVSNFRGVPMRLVVLTDGVSNSPIDTITAAHQASEAGIETFSVGIGNTRYEELYSIAGNNTENMFTLETFDDLIKILVPVSIKLCPNTN